ncbi:MAG: hypothetical protein H6Q07_2434, partial [Acidobacteria bacterium]|nr:hypothetical protein [Acidobacteriota bacterium]
MRVAQKQRREGLIVGGRYQIEKPIGLQDVGEVYLCRDLASGKCWIRMKILHEFVSREAPASSLSQRFSLLLRLRHPNLARTIDFGLLEDPPKPFLVDEWFEGKDLYAATRGMDQGQVLALVVALSE